MFTPEWILSVAQKSPRVALVAILLACLTVSWGAVSYVTKDRISSLAEDVHEARKETAGVRAENITLRNTIQYRDSSYHAEFREYQEVKDKQMQDFLQKVNRDQAEQLKEQRQVERLRQGIYQNNKHLIQKNNSIIKKSDNAQQ